VRTASPLGMRDGKGMKGPRPLPNPFAMGKQGSQGSLHAVPNSSSGGVQPSRSGTGDAEEEEVPQGPVKPSRKALGKRRALPVEESESKRVQPRR
jgi:hypothetical protein